MGVEIWCISFLDVYTNSAVTLVLLGRYKHHNHFQKLQGNDIVPGDVSQINTELKAYL